MHYLWAVKDVTRVDRLQTITISEDPFTPESITDVVRNRRWFGHVWDSIDSGREEGHRRGGVTRSGMILVSHH